MRSLLLLAQAGLSLGPALLISAEPPPPGPVLVSAAASIATLMERIGSLFTARTGVEVQVNGGGSVLLAQQILRGAPADVFVPAGDGPLQRLLPGGLIDEGSVFPWLTNRLVVVAPADRAAPLAAPEEMAGKNVRRLAIGDPDLVPAGAYARQALRALGVWDRLQSRIVTAPDVRAALAYVESGEADLGIVYRTDARITARVGVVLEIPASTHEPIRYPVARVARAGASPAVGTFLEFLRRPEVREVLVEAGFTPAFP